MNIFIYEFPLILPLHGFKTYVSSYVHEIITVHLM